MIELTAEQQRLLDVAHGVPPVVIDPRTQATYVLIRATNHNEQLVGDIPCEPNASDIPEGIRRAKAAIRRDLPELLASRRTRGKYVCYHLEQQIGIDKDYYALIRECNRLNIPDGEFFIDQIAPGAGSAEEEEIETTFV